MTRGSGGAPTTVGFPCMSGAGHRCGSSLPGPRGTGAPACVRGHSPGGRSPPCSWTCEWRGGVCAAGWPCAPLAATCPAAGCWGPSGSGLPGILGCWVQSGGLVADGRSRSPCALACRAPLARAVLVGTPPSCARGRRGPPRSGSVGASLPLCALPCGRPGVGGGGGSGGRCPSGEHPSPARRPGLGPLGARSSPRPSPTVPSASCVAAFALCGAAGGGGGGGRAARPALRRDGLQLSSAAGGTWRSWALGVAARVSGKWSVVSRSEGDSIAVRARASRAAGLRLPGGTPTRVPAAVVAPRIRGHAFPPPNWVVPAVGGPP